MRTGGSEALRMAASTWQSCGYLRDDTSQARGTDCATSRGGSAVARQECSLQPRQQGLGATIRAHGPAMSSAGMEGESPPKVYEMQVGQQRAGSGRTVRPVVYRLEESEYRRLLKEAEEGPEEDWEPENEGLAPQEGCSGNGVTASPRLHRIDVLRGAPLIRSYSESSVELRVASKAPGCPTEGGKPRVPARSDSFELMDYILQSRQEAGAPLSHSPRDGFMQVLGFAPCQNGEDGQLTKSRAARDAGKLTRQNSTQVPESSEWLGADVDMEMLESYSQKKSPPAPPVRLHSKESLALSMSKTVALSEALLEPCSPAARPGGKEPTGGGPKEQGRKSEEEEEEEEEKVLKVADAKKTFEKAKAEGKAAASSARKGEGGNGGSGAQLCKMGRKGSVGWGLRGKASCRALVVSGTEF